MEQLEALLTLNFVLNSGDFTINRNENVKKYKMKNEDEEK